MMKPYRLAAFAAVLLVGAVTPAAKAVTVTYSTQGVFASSGTNALAQSGVTVNYNPFATSLDASPTSVANFGSFSVTGPTDGSATFGDPVVDAFTLTINQSAPTPGGSASFTSTITGTITFSGGVGGSQAFAVFTPLSQTIGNVTYQITSADNQTPGRVNIAAQGASTIIGQITVASPIPEPGTMALAGIALPLLGVGYLRRRRTA